MNAPGEIGADVTRLGDRAPRATAFALVTGGLALAAAVGLGAAGGDWGSFFRSYLLNYCFVLSLALGALFFVLLQHLTRAGWSVSLRRMAEVLAATLPTLTILFVPLLVPLLSGRPDLWRWSSPAEVAGDPVLRGKAPYLNVPFFLVRCAICFAVWTLLARYYLRQSVAQDASGDPRHTLAMQWWSGPGMLAYALTVTFFAFDTLMSLNPYWYSTIFGVYYFSGGLVGFFALLVLLTYVVQRRGLLARVVTVEHYHDLGKLLFGFTVFWSYIAFSQYMLMWYANIPEETFWWQPRHFTPWWAGVSLLLLLGHFVAPFLALISRRPKRRPGLLAAVAAWLLFMHWLDLYWLVAPRPLADPPGGTPLHATDVVLAVALLAVLLAVALHQMGRCALVPLRDPRLSESLHYENV